MLRFTRCADPRVSSARRANIMAADALVAARVLVLGVDDHQPRGRVVGDVAGISRPDLHPGERATGTHLMFVSRRTISAQTSSGRSRSRSA